MKEDKHNKGAEWIERELLPHIEGRCQTESRIIGRGLTLESIIIFIKDNSDKWSSETDSLKITQGGTGDVPEADREINKSKTSERNNTKCDCYKYREVSCGICKPEMIELLDNNVISLDPEDLATEIICLKTAFNQLATAINHINKRQS